MKSIRYLKKEIFPFATTCLNLEGFMLNETSQTKKDKNSIVSLTCRIKKFFKRQMYRNKIKWWFPGASGWGKCGEISQRVQIFFLSFFCSFV